MDKKWSGSHCSHDSKVNIVNSVSTPTQTILILALPLIQTFTYPNSLLVIAWKKVFAQEIVDTD